MIIYLTASALACALFYLLERLFLSKSTLFYAQRTYFIVAILSSLFLPAIALLSPEVREITSSISAHQATVQVSVEGMTAEVIGGEAETPSKAIVIVAKLMPFLFWIWLVGAILMLLRYMWGHLSIRRTLRHSEMSVIDGINVYLIDGESTPFTYIKRIAIPREICDQPMLPMVLKHENVHVQQSHYIDLLVGSILQITQWWNPFAWGLTALHKDALEYIADSEVIREGASHKEYQLYLLKSTIGRTADSLLLSFSMYNLKKRIFMMNKKKTTSKRVGLAYALIALPVMSLTVLSTQAINSNSTVRNIKALSIESQSTEHSNPSSQANDILSSDKDEKLMILFEANAKYPAEAIEKEIQGLVTVLPIENEDGTISAIKVGKESNPMLVKEVVRVLKLSGKMDNVMYSTSEIASDETPISVLFVLDGAKKPLDRSEYKSDLVITAYAKDKAQSTGDNEVFEYLDEMPDFPGGQAKMMQWLEENIKYPNEAFKKGIQGRVMVNFIVEKDGSISNIKVLRGVDPLLDAEAIRVVGLMPKWQPGTQNGKPVRFSYVVPVIFKLNDGKKDAIVRANNVESVGADGVYQSLDDMPEFPSGQSAMMQYLAGNVKYPKEAKDNKIQGRVMVQFVIEADGSITNAKILRGVDESLDNEALRVVNAMPKWKPGYNKAGKAVRTRYTIPVNFKIN